MNASPSSAASSARETPGSMPNIVFLMSDDHGWHETGYNGHPIVQTPVLDEMASEGLRLDSFYSGAPLCSPTRASVMTGRHPNRCGTFNPGWSIRPEEITIAQILSRAGYACGHFGKWHLGPVKADSPTNPRAMGFEEYLSHDNFFDMDPYLSHNGGPPEKYEGESSQIVVDAASRFISDARAAGRPFFVVAWFGSPHEPYSALDEDLATYGDLPEELQQSTAQITSLETGEQVHIRLDRVLQARYAEITAMDRAIGDLRQHLSREQIRDETLLWYCGDNGAPRESRFASPMRGYKGLVYEGGIRVPAVIEWPDRFKEPNRLSMDSVTSDILPTLCELTGQPLPDRPLDGISLVPAMEGEAGDRPDPICFWSFGGSVADDAEPYIDPDLQSGTCPLAKLMDGKFTRDFENYHHPEIREDDFEGPRAILDSRYKLVIDGEPGTGQELFDIRADASEKSDLSTVQPQEVQRLGTKLKEWQQSVLESLTGADYA